MASRRRRKKATDEGVFLLGTVAGLYLLTETPKPSSASVSVPAQKPPKPQSLPPPEDEEIILEQAPIGELPPESEASDSVMSQLIVHYGPGKRNVNSIDGYRRAKNDEVRSAPTLMKEIQTYLKNPIGHVSFRNYDGKDWALAVEAHDNHPEMGPTNKGVSVFVSELSDTGVFEDNPQARNALQLPILAGIVLVGYKLLA